MTSLTSARGYLKKEREKEKKKPAYTRQIIKQTIERNEEGT